MLTQENITIAQRITAPKPKVFKTLLKVGGILMAVGGSLVAAPVAPIVATIAGYLFAAGSAATAVASLPVDFEALAKKQTDE